MLKQIVFCLLITLLLSIEIRLIANDLPHSSTRMEEINSLKLTINSNGKYLYPHHQNTFTLPTLPSGRNMVEVISTYHVYPLLMIDTKSTGENVFKFVHPFTREIMQSTGEPIYMKPIDKLQYLYEQPGFSLSGFLFSGTGMFLMFGVGMYLCYNQLMPKMEEAQLAPQSARAHRQ